MKLLYKLLSGYLILALLVLITDGVSRWSYRNLEHTYHRISSRALPHIQSLEKAQATVLRMVASTSEYALFVSAREEQRHQPHEEDDDAIESSSPTFRAGDRERKEIHPRVKINLPIISSLLKMQARKITDPNFVNSQNRVKYKALIHESLYPSSALSQIDVDDYWRKPASLILRSYNLHAERIRLNFGNTRLQIGVDAAVPCGLIISPEMCVPGGARGRNQCGTGNHRGTFHSALSRTTFTITFPACRREQHNCSTEKGTLWKASAF